MRLQITSSLGAVLFLSAALASAQAPIIDAGQPVNSTRATPASGAAASGGSVTGDLLIQLQSLQQEVMELRGIVEEQRHQLQTMKQQELDRYNDLDQRLGRAQGNVAPVQTAPVDASTMPVAPDTAVAPVAAPASSATPPPAAVISAPASTAASMETAKPEEYEAYQIAYSTKFKGQDYKGAIKAFNAFLATYPKSPLVPNSYFWLGQSYLLDKPQDLNKAQAAFAKVGEYPQSSKVADALYGLGKVYFLQGDKAKAKMTLQQVIDNYGASGSTAPQSAKLFLDQNFPASKH